MTKAQWLFEYHAIRKRETDAFKLDAELRKATLEAQRALLISLLGLNVVAPKPKLPDVAAGDSPTGDAVTEHAEPADDDVPPFIPLSFLVGDPAVMKAIMDRYERDSAATEGAQDVAFDEFSKALHNQLKTGKSELPGDMIPLLLEEPKVAQKTMWNSPEVQATLRALGVKPRSKDAPAAPHITIKPPDPFTTPPPDLRGGRGFLGSTKR